MSIELLLAAAVAAGFFGSGHCIGMCGPVVVLLEGNRQAGSRFQSLMRRVLYNTGRLAFYMLLGGVAGGSGAILTKLAGADVALMALRVLASLLVIALGANLLWNIQSLAFIEKAGAKIWARMSLLTKHVLPINTPARAFGAGVIWGALPCGLVYGIVAIAATSGDTVSGAAVMLALWIGTLPALLTAGASATKLKSLSGRIGLRKFVGVTMVLVGAFSLIMPLMHDRNSAAPHSHGTQASVSHPATDETKKRYSEQ